MLKIREVMGDDMEACKTDLRVTTPWGDRIRIVPGPGRREEVYAWVMGLVESLKNAPDAAAVKAAPFPKGTKGRK